MQYLIIHDSQNDIEEFKDMTKGFKQRGVRAIIYGKKELSKQQTENYVEKYLLYKQSLVP